MATQYENLGPIYTTAAKYEAAKLAETLEAGREYRIVDWEAQAKLTAGNGIDITNNIISLDGDASIAIYDNRVADANSWLTNGYTKTSAETPTANLPAVCTGDDRWGVLLYVAENNENKAGLQQYFPIDGSYKGRIFYRSVTGWGAGIDPEFGDWNLVPWSEEKQDIISDLATIRSGAEAGGTAVQPSAISDMATKTYSDDKYEPWLGDKGNVPEWKTEDPGAGQALHIPYNFVFTPDANKLDIKMYTVTADGNNTYNEWDNSVPPANSIEAMSYLNAGLMTSSDATALRTTIPNAIANKQDALTSIAGYDATKTQTLKNINGTLTWVDD